MSAVDENLNSLEDLNKDGLHQRKSLEKVEDKIDIGDEPKQKKTKYEIASIFVGNFIVILYFSYATYYYIYTRDTCVKDCDLTLCSSFGMLIFVFSATYVGLFYFKILKPYFGQSIYNSILQPALQGIRNIFKSLISRIFLGIIILAAFFAYIIYETYSDLTRLRALGGIVIFFAIGLLISANPRKINWRPVICGAIFQFLLGVIFIRLPVGRRIFQCFGNKVAQFLDFGKVGAAFVFGDFLVYDIGVFAFAILTTIFFFSLCISVLYYLEVMQWVLFKLGWILQSILGTTVCESVNAAGNIFLASEGLLMIRPYLKYLTHSEFHSILTSLFATVSGSTLVAYINFGAEPAHLITASVMAAPASLFFSKLVYPEVEESKTSSDNIQLEKSSDTSVLDAASNGANQAISLILNIIANLVAFVAFVAFADGIIKWITYLMGFPQVDLQYLLGKIFIPISWIIGVEWKDCELVGNVIGTKTIVNEFVAFKILGDYKDANAISLRSSAIATFAICSFANPASIGIMIGALSALAPGRRQSVTKVAVRAFVAANFVTLITASIAGLLLTNEMIEGA